MNRASARKHFLWLATFFWHRMNCWQPFGWFGVALGSQLAAKGSSKSSFLVIISLPQKCKKLGSGVSVIYILKFWFSMVRKWNLLGTDNLWNTENLIPKWMPNSVRYRYVALQDRIVELLACFSSGRNFRSLKGLPMMRHVGYEVPPRVRRLLACIRGREGGGDFGTTDSSGGLNTGYWVNAEY